jgi:hypothetical protein
MQHMGYGKYLLTSITDDEAQSLLSTSGAEVARENRILACIAQPVVFHVHTLNDLT